MNPSGQQGIRGAYRYLFGPLHSRRLGRSLGVDLVPPKTCTADCPYCEVGRTTCRTWERREYVPVDEVLGELQRWFHEGGSADAITLAGSGEPTLHARFGEVLQAVRHLWRVQRVVLSNGMLLWIPEVRRDAQAADIFKATLSAWDERSFSQVHRPHPHLKFARFFDGLCAFREEFQGKLWLEVFLVRGINDTDEGVRAIAQAARQIRPDRIHLNTVVRPPAEPAVQPVEADRLKDWAQWFDPVAEVASVSPEVGMHAPGSAEGSGPKDLAVRIREVLRRRGCRAEELASGLGVSLQEVRKALDQLVMQGEARLDRKTGVGYYRETHPTQSSESGPAEGGIAGCPDEMRR